MDTMTQQGTDGGRHRTRLDRYGQLAGVLLGVVAGGVAVNLFADDYRYRGLTAATAAGAVLATASWLRRLSAQAPQAPLARNATRVLLIAALPALLLAAAGPEAWQPWAVTVAATLTITAVLIPVDPPTAATLLSGVAFIGVGVEFAAFGVAVLTGGDALAGVAAIGLGAAFAVVGVAVLTGGDALAGVAAIGLGAAVAVVGVAAPPRSAAPFGVAVMGFGAAVAAFGVVALTRIGPLAGMAIIGGGAATAAYGGAALIGADTLAKVAEIGGGAALAVFGVVGLIGAPILFGVAVIGVGGRSPPVVSGGCTVGAAGRRVRAWWDRMTSDPAQLPGTGPPEPGEDAGPAADPVAG